MPWSSRACLCQFGVQCFDLFHVVVAAEEYRGSLVDLGWDQIKSLPVPMCQLVLRQTERAGLTQNKIVSIIFEENEQRQKSYPFFSCEGLTSSLLHEEWHGENFVQNTAKPNQIESASEVCMQLANGCQIRIGISLPELSIRALLVSRVQKYTPIEQGTVNISNHTIKVNHQRQSVC